MSNPGYQDHPGTPPVEPAYPAYPATVFPSQNPPPAAVEFPPGPFSTAYEPLTAPAATPPAPVAFAVTAPFATAPDESGAVPTGTPVPSAPTYDPAMAQPYSAQPYPGQLYPGQSYPGQPYPAQPYPGVPVSGPYGYGVPMMSAIPAPAPPRRRTGMILLSIVTALLLAATGVLGTLFAIRNSDANDLANQVTQLNSAAQTSRNKTDGLQKDLDGAKRDLTDSKAQNDDLTKQRTMFADCLNALIDEGKAMDAANGRVTAEVKAKQADTNAKCNKAQSLL